MTIAISLKVHEGLVLASDSATTVLNVDQRQALNVYNNACKITNLHKGTPIGCITWGAGGVGQSSITTLTKDFRARLASGGLADDYTVEGVAKQLAQFVGERWESAMSGLPEDSPPQALGFIVAGYSAGSVEPEEYRLVFGPDGCQDPQLLRPRGSCGMTWNGEPEAISRLVTGVDPRVQQILEKSLGAPADQAGQAYAIMRSQLEHQVVNPAMPIQDAIDLARFMVELTINWKRFIMGAPTVGGPVEIAAITRHEGFKWVQRKHYFSATLNPDD